MSHWNLRYEPHGNTFARVWQVGRPFLLLVCLLLDAPAQQRPPQTEVRVAKDIWAESLVAGGSAGYYHEAMKMDRDREIVTSIETDLIFNRLESKVEMKSSSRYREGDDGRLLGIHAIMSSSAQPTTMEVTVKEKSLAIRTTTGGKAYERTLEFTGELLGPEAARRLTISRLKSPGDKVSYQMFVPELGSVTTITNTLAGMERIAVEGERKQALKMEQAMAAMPGKSLVWLDETGWLLRQATPSPFGDIEIVLSSAEKIEGRQVKGATLPAESFGSTLVNLERPFTGRAPDRATEDPHHPQEAGARVARICIGKPKGAGARAGPRSARDSPRSAQRARRTPVAVRASRADAVSGAECAVAIG